MRIDRNQASHMMAIVPVNFELPCGKGHGLAGGSEKVRDRASRRLIGLITNLLNSAYREVSGFLVGKCSEN
jgi:hypothetical protein